MARQSAGSGLWSIILTIAALNFIGLAAFIGGMVGFGFMSTETLQDLVKVFRGSHVALSRRDAAEFQRLLDEEAARRDELKAETGAGAVYAESLEARQRQAEMLEQEMEVMVERLGQERRKLLAIRSQIEAGKQEAAQTIDDLEALKERRTRAELSEKTQRLQKTFANMDAADIATDLEAAAAGGESGLEYAAHMLGLMKPMQVSEVLTEMAAGVRQQILPLLENPYANTPAEQVVEEWRASDPPVSARQIQAYFQRMPPTQVMQVWRRLDRLMRDDVLDLMAPLPDREGGAL
jgi:hypothetical protein